MNDETQNHNQKHKNYYLFALIALLIAFLGFVNAQQALDSVFTFNLTGRPAMGNFTILNCDGNLTCTQDTANHTINISSSANVTVSAFNATYDETTKDYDSNFSAETFPNSSLQLNKLDIPPTPCTNTTFLQTFGSTSTSCHAIPSAGSLTYYFGNLTSTNTHNASKQMLTSPNSTKITLNYPSVSNGQILQNWTTEPGSPGISFIPAGSYVFHIHASRTGNPASSVSIYGEFWEVNSTGYNLQKIGSSEQSPALPTIEAEYPLIFVAANTTILNGADSRIMLRVNTTGVSGNVAVNLIFGEEADSHISLPSNTVDASNFVPYTGATTDVNLGTHNITVSQIINQTRIITNTSASSYFDSLDIGTGTNISSVSVTNNFTLLASVEQCLTGCHAYDFSSIEIYPSHINITSKNVTIISADGKSSIKIPDSSLGSILLRQEGALGGTANGSISVDGIVSMTSSDDTAPQNASYTLTTTTHRLKVNDTTIVAINKTGMGLTGNLQIFGNVNGTNATFFNGSINYNGNLLSGLTPTFSGWTVNPGTNSNLVGEGSLGTLTTSGTSNAGSGKYVQYNLNDTKRIAASSYAHASVGTMANSYIMFSLDCSNYFIVWLSPSASNYESSAVVGQTKCVRYVWDISVGGATIDTIQLRAYNI